MVHVVFLTVKESFLTKKIPRGRGLPPRIVARLDLTPPNDNPWGESTVDMDNLSIHTLDQIYTLPTYIFPQNIHQKNIPPAYSLEFC